MCVDKNDVILTTSPAYGLYKHQAALLGAVFDTISTEVSGFVPTAQQIIDLFELHSKQQRNVRALVLCFPNNPTSVMLTEYD